jgi:hypothetical protein
MFVNPHPNLYATGSAVRRGNEMKKQSLIMAVAVFGLILLNSNAIAGYFDTGWSNITEYDGHMGGSSNPDYNTWWNTTNEDQEVEPGAQIGQEWDLEGFFLSDGTDPSVSDNELAMAGGFNFETGQGGVASGDIFIDTVMNNGYYEYVMDLNFDTGKYSVYKSTEGNEIEYNTPNRPGPTITENTAWTYKSGGVDVDDFQNIALNYLDNDQLNSLYGGVGGTLQGSEHNVVTVNLSFLGGNTDFAVLNTMQCGNDVIFGEGTSTAAVPEPATIFLLGSGLLGLFGFRKKIRKTDS